MSTDVTSAAIADGSPPPIILAGRRSTQLLPIDSIVLGERLRPVIEDKALDHLREAIADIGQHTPIMVRRIEGVDGGHTHHLISGAHRLAAQKKRGETEIECVVLENCSDEDARLLEISENLHRKQLKPLERGQMFAEWMRIKNARRISCQSDKKSRGRPRGGVSAAAHEFGISVSDAHRAVKVDGLTDDAKETAKEVGLDNDRSALLAAADAKPEDQAGVLRDKAAAKQKRAAARKEAPVDRKEERADASAEESREAPPEVRPDAGAKEDNGSVPSPGAAVTAGDKGTWLADGRAWWKAAPDDWRKEFLAEIFADQLLSDAPESSVAEDATSTGGFPNPLTSPKGELG